MQDLREPVQLVLNAFPLQDSHRGRGIGRYTYEVYKHILERWETGDEKLHDAFAGITLVGATNPSLDAIFEQQFRHVRYFSVPGTVVSRNILKFLYYKVFVTPSLTKLFSSFSERSVYFLPRHQILSHPKASYTVTMVHDLAPLRTKRFGKNKVLDPYLRLEYGWYLHELAKSDLVITNSSDTALAVKQQLPSVKHIQPILLGNAFEAAPAETLRRQPAPLVDPYFVYYGGYDYNKNIPGIIKGFATFIRKHEDTNRTKLVFSGGKHAQELIIPLAKEEGILENIVLAEYLPDDELAYYLVHSLGLFRLSFMEGCGLPEIEAMSLGVPVISSNIQAVFEMVGDFAFLVSPNNPLAAEPILYKIAKKKISPEALKAATAHARTFTWAKTADETVDAVIEFVQTTKPRQTSK